MEIMPQNYTVADYCRDLKRQEIQVNRQYQRSDKVWPTAARSFLIETILQNYPMPKLSLHQRVDLKSKTAFKEIVDGQQRTTAILDFFENKFRLSRKLETTEVAGRTYSELPDDFQARFLNYRLAADVFLDATPEAIREVFRRINSYTVPLNPEEQRHATYQGAFKWFVYRLSKSNDSALARIGTFGEKQFVRMADAKLYTEIVHALVNGIRTTKKVELESLYKKFDDTFDREAEVKDAVEGAITQVDQWVALHQGPLVRPHMLYSFLLALIHVREPQAVLLTLWDQAAGQSIGEQALQRLSELAEVLESPEDGQDPRFGKFVAASTSKTNVGAEREERFRWFCRALSGVDWA